MGDPVVYRIVELIGAFSGILVDALRTVTEAGKVVPMNLNRFIN